MCHLIFQHTAQGSPFLTIGIKGGRGGGYKRRKYHRKAVVRLQTFLITEAIAKALKARTFNLGGSGGMLPFLAFPGGIFPKT